MVFFARMIYTPAASESAPVEQASDASPSMRLFAEVGVRMGAYSAAPAVLSYYVPAVLQEHVKQGSLVWVPVRNQQVQGIVLSLSNVPPAADVSIRPLAD